MKMLGKISCVISTWYQSFKAHVLWLWRFGCCWSLFGDLGSRRSKKVYRFFYFFLLNLLDLGFRFLFTLVCFLDPGTARCLIDIADWHFFSFTCRWDYKFGQKGIHSESHRLIPLSEIILLGSDFITDKPL